MLKESFPDIVQQEYHLIEYLEFRSDHLIPDPELEIPYRQHGVFDSAFVQIGQKIVDSESAGGVDFGSLRNEQYLHCL